MELIELTMIWTGIWSGVGTRFCLRILMACVSRYLAPAVIYLQPMNITQLGEDLVGLCLCPIRMLFDTMLGSVVVNEKTKGAELRMVILHSMLIAGFFPSG